jgi:hypothetical protein
MRSLLARLAVLGAFAVSLSACTNGSAGALPFAGPPNNAGGVPGQIQTGGNSFFLLRFVQGSPDTFSFFGGPPASGTVDVCIDNIPFGVLFPAVSYGTSSPVLYTIAGGITHTIAVYPTQGGANVGLECPTAPGPYLGVSTIAVSTMVTPANTNVRWTVVLGGTAAAGTLGLYMFGDPTFAIAPAGPEVISHNAAPNFSKGPPVRGVGFGICTTTVTPCTVATNLTGAQNVAAPKVSTTGASVVNPTVQSSINSVPAGFYDGTGVPAGTVVPITSVAAPNQVALQPYVIQLYAIDGPAGGLNLVPVAEQTLGFGF